MAKKQQKSNRLFWLLLFQNLKSQKNAGFSLVEKLATLVMASLITTGLIGMTVQFIQSDQQEAAFSATEKETEIALNYITEDLREAVYVYDEFTPQLMNALPNFTNLPDLGVNTKPVLIFWKTETIPENQLPSGCTAAQGFITVEQQDECDLVRNQRTTYSLVVYLQSTDPNTKWKGKSRIARYSLPEYTNPTILKQSIGFADPAKYNNFVTWPYDKDDVNQQQQKPSPTTYGEPKPMVLVDFIDIPNRSEFKSASKPNLPPPPTNCPSDYLRVPTNVSTDNSFYACVRRTNKELGTNQDIILYLRGNAEGRDQLVKTVDYIPSLEAQVTLRGVIDKFD